MKGKTENRTIYDLKLNESLYINKDGITIRRVPGGWIYSYFDKEENFCSQEFVPYHEEFLK